MFVQSYCGKRLLLRSEDQQELLFSECSLPKHARINKNYFLVSVLLIVFSVCTIVLWRQCHRTIPEVISTDDDDDLLQQP